MSLKRLQHIIDNAGHRSRPRTPKQHEPGDLIQAVVTIAPSRRSVAVEVFRDGKMQFIPEIPSHHADDHLSGSYLSLDDLAKGVIDDLAEKALRDAVEIPDPPKSRPRRTRVKS